jgi:hypothetical protein
MNNHLILATQQELEKASLKIMFFSLIKHRRGRGNRVGEGGKVSGRERLGVAEGRGKKD